MLHWLEHSFRQSTAQIDVVKLTLTVRCYPHASHAWLRNADSFASEQIANANHRRLPEAATEALHSDLPNLFCAQRLTISAHGDPHFSQFLKENTLAQEPMSMPCALSRQTPMDGTYKFDLLAGGKEQ